MFSRFSRPFHSTPTRPAVPHLLYLFAKPLARVTAILLGKTARIYWRRLPADKKTLFRATFAAHRTSLVLGGGTVGAGVLWSYESHIQPCPVTGRRRYGQLTPRHLSRDLSGIFPDLFLSTLTRLKKYQTENSKKIWRISMSICYQMITAII